MPSTKNQPLANGHLRTEYQGITYRLDTSGERTYYAKYRDPEGIQRLEKIGKSSQGWTPARAKNERAARITGKNKPNQVRRHEKQAAKLAMESRWNLERLLAHYLESRKPKAAKDDRSRFKNYLHPLAQKTPEEILSLDVERIKRTMTKTKGLNEATVANVLELLRRLCNFGFKQGLTSKLSFHLTIHRPDNRKTEYLDNEQWLRLVKVLDDAEAAGSKRMAMGSRIMRLQLLTGMRHGEVLKLRWHDADLNREFLTIRDSKSGKNEIKQLSNAALQVLQRQKEAFCDSEYVFPGGIPGQHIKDTKRTHNKLKELAGLPKDFRPNHGLRHAYASRLAEEGVEIYTIQKMLTHKSPQMTQRYAHLQPKALKEAEEIVAQFGS
jgi:integrase